MDLRELNDTQPWDWSHDAGDTILAALRDEKAHEADRLLAAALAGDVVVIDDSLAGMLLQLLRRKEASDELRATAATSLGPILELAAAEGLDDPDSVPISQETFREIKKQLRSVYADQAVLGAQHVEHRGNWSSTRKR